MLKVDRNTLPVEWILFKAHPDVLAGNRTGQDLTRDGFKNFGPIVTGVNYDNVLSYADEVHTLTSLVGFEALMRGKKVVTYGQPFYSGWGLTVDKHVNPRRTRQLTLDELVAGALIVYPRYIDPVTHELCEIENVFSGLEAQQDRLKRSWLLRRWKIIRNSVVRNTQAMFRKKRV